LKGIDDLTGVLLHLSNLLLIILCVLKLSLRVCGGVIYRPLFSALLSVTDPATMVLFVSEFGHFAMSCIAQLHNP